MRSNKGIVPGKQKIVKENRIKESLKPYTQAMPDILNYQIVTKLLICIWLFLFTTWQGIFILLLGIVSLFVYVAFDINSKVVLSRNLLTGRNESLESSIKEGFFSIGKLINVRGILVVLVFLSVGIANLFILHGVIIDGLPIGESGRQSRKLIRANWKDYLKQNVLFIVMIFVSLAGTILRSVPDML